VERKLVFADSELKNTRSELAKLRTKSEALEMENKARSVKNIELERELALKKGEKTQLNEEVARFKSALFTSNTNLDVVQRELGPLKLTGNNLKAEAASAKAAKEQAEERHKITEEELAKKTSELEGVRRELSVVGRQKDEVEAAVGKQIKALQTQITVLTETNADLTEKMSRARQEVEARESALRSEVASGKAALAERINATQKDTELRREAEQ
jgi:chromosome segregation ATPase